MAGAFCAHPLPCCMASTDAAGDVLCLLVHTMVMFVALAVDTFTPSVRKMRPSQSDACKTTALSSLDLITQSDTWTGHARMSKSPHETYA